MLADFRDFEAGATLECDLCVIGGGSVESTLARQFIDSANDVCLSESGGLDSDAERQALYGGENLGAEYYPLGRLASSIPSWLDARLGRALCPPGSDGFRGSALGLLQRLTLLPGASS